MRMFGLTPGGSGRVFKCLSNCHAQKNYICFVWPQVEREISAQHVERFVAMRGNKHP